MQINIEKRHAFMIIGAILILAIVIGINAYGTSNPSNFGHSAGELEGVCLSDGTNCPAISSSCSLACASSYSGTSPPTIGNPCKDTSYDVVIGYTKQERWPAGYNYYEVCCRVDC